MLGKRGGAREEEMDVDVEERGGEIGRDQIGKPISKLYFGQPIRPLRKISRL